MGFVKPTEVYFNAADYAELEKQFSEMNVIIEAQKVTILELNKSLKKKDKFVDKLQLCIDFDSSVSLDSDILMLELHFSNGSRPKLYGKKRE